VRFEIGSQALILSIAVLFGLFGFRRGLKRELIVLLGIALGSLLATTQVEFLTVWINRFYKIGIFVAKGGLSQELGSASLGPMRQLVETGDDKMALAVVTFLIVVVMAYLLGRVLAKASPSWTEKFMGALVGAVNGFLISRFVYPKVLHTPRTNIVIPSEEVSQQLTAGSRFALVLVGVVVVLIVYGVRSSSGSSGRGN